MKTKNIARIICLLSFLLFVSQAWAEEWVKYTSHTFGDVYYDKSSVKKIDKNIVSISSKQILNEDGKTKYFSLLKISDNKLPESSDMLSYKLISSEIDCLNKKFKSSSMTIYDKQDQPIYTATLNYEVWTKIIPQTSWDNLKSRVCSSGKTPTSKKKK